MVERGNIAVVSLTSLRPLVSTCYYIIASLDHILLFSLFISACLLLRKVAIKIVDKATIADVEDVERVYRETFILTTLKHRNIIKLHEVVA